jgi:hypothetical protein
MKLSWQFILFHNTHTQPPLAAQYVTVVTHTEPVGPTNIVFPRQMMVIKV